MTGLYNTKIDIDGSQAIEDSIFDDWNNWLHWDVNTADLVTPVEGLEDSIAGSTCSPEFSDIESPVTDVRSTSYFHEAGMLVEDAPFDIDEEARSMFSGAISTTTSSLLESTTFKSDTALQPVTRNRNGDFSKSHEADRLSSEMKKTSTTKPRRMKTFPQQVESSPRRGRKRKVSSETEPDTTCLSKNRGHNAIEKRYRYTHLRSDFEANTHHSQNKSQRKDQLPESRPSTIWCRGCR